MQAAIKFNRIKKWRTRSPQETMERARLMGRALRPGTLIALVGALGSGKTTFVKGLALGLGFQDVRDVRSPSFVIFHIYKGRLPLYHFDLYRLERPSDLDTAGIEEFLHDRKAVSVVEWADRVSVLCEQADILIQLRRLGESAREIKLYPRGI